jgi:3-hydroxy-3-methylglutaryl CoA synthase
VGLKIGREADSLLARGEALPTGLRRGVQLGTVLTGASLASLVSLLPASQREGQKTETILYFSIGGALVGAIVQAILNDRLDPDRSVPSIQVGRTWDGKTFLGVALRR